ncbi:Polyunsaturated fatty acid lipoxygenase alox15 [Saguinus oedipus]|uniref:Polyunsaturated fatty acid lipoxygenase alox15 n=1 Tax=Saguinus oedipus TaxID=9490 RepID=A0ABQ9VNE9_SAGOE|nr:Polyunsaturated fatty acid lipoxygenase alox15 [Saguinus oedipus]
MAGAKLCDLPVDERFLEDKRIDFEASLAKGLADLAIKDTFNVLACWKDLDDFNRIFWCGQSKLAGQPPTPIRLPGPLPPDPT